MTTDSKARVVSDDPQWSPASPAPLVHRGSRCFVLRPFPTGITSEWWTGISSPAFPPAPSSHLILSVLIQVGDPDQGATVASFVIVSCVAHTCTCGQRAEAVVSQRGLDKRRQWLLTSCGVWEGDAAEHTGFSLPLEFEKYVNAG